MELPNILANLFGLMYNYNIIDHSFLIFISLSHQINIILQFKYKNLKIKYENVLDPKPKCQFNESLRLRVWNIMLGI